MVGHLTYHFDESSNFKIDKETGEIRLINLLDREKTDEYTVNVQVTDEIQSTNATVVIEVNFF